VAEEFSILDNITGGRLITGFVRGVGIEYHTAAVNPVDSLERYREAHDIILRAWTERQPFAYEGKHYRFPHLNLFPPPFQKPHPPIWVPSTGSKDTIEWAAAPARKYTYLQFFNRDYNGVKALLLQYRETARRFGYEAHEDQLGWATPVYVAKTDEQAMREARPHMEAMFNDFMFMTPEMLFPPGYLTPEALNAVMAAKLGITGKARTAIEDLVAQGRILVGSPETIRRFLVKAHEEIRFGHFLPLLHFGTLPADLTRNNIELFAAEVMAPLRDRLAEAKRVAVSA
jgi:alkanesulfonate monooxygenase SsuD/methylene tetrahydromethanopterin reductase-like flavin-dependent oxidoreductase (luciferase family)